MKTVEKGVKSDGSIDNNPLNRDPISGKPGAHPVGTGVGAAAAGAAGAAIGTAVGGPVGTVVGAVVGVLGGGLAGKAAGEAVNPTADTVETVTTGTTLDTGDYWRTQYDKEPYYQSGLTYDDYEPAYRTAISGYKRNAGKSYEEVRSELERDYVLNRGHSNLDWDRAESATRAAWHRLERALPGDFDNDGR